MATAAEKRAAKIADQRVERAYYKSCSGVQVSILDIPKVFEFGRIAVARGDDDEALASAVRAYVDKLNEKGAVNARK